jgi:hypothetical protein
MTLAKPQGCEGCDKPYSAQQLRNYKNTQLCAACYQVEIDLSNLSTAAAMQPPIASLPEHKTWSVLAVQQELSKRISQYISMNHQDFFNQEVEEVKNLSMEELRARIEEMSEAYFGAEAEAIRKKTKYQAAGSVFNDRINKLSETEKAEIRKNDKNYVPKLANPLKQKPDKAKAAKKKLEDGLAALFGDGAAEAMKKLGL